MQTWLQRLGLHPILVDVGAAYSPPPIWQSIATESIYLGFDPDLREIRSSQNEGYYQATFINRAVTAQEQAEVHFFLTHYPQSSSTLPPNLAELQHYIYADFFRVTGETQAPAITLDAALAQAGLSQIHWFKTDSQGTDLRLFKSLSHPVLAVDMEPGLINAYQGEDLFAELHPYMLANGFWLSTMEVKGTLRGADYPAYTPADYKAYTRALKNAPAWCEVRYLRTDLGDAPLADYQLLWVFALVDEQLGFAWEVLAKMEKRFGKSALLAEMQSYTQQQIQNALAKYQAKPSLLRRIYNRLGRFIP